MRLTSSSRSFTLSQLSPLLTIASLALAAYFAGCATSEKTADVINEQYTFATPDEAALSLADAAGNLDGRELNLVLGPDLGWLSSGDRTQDDINLQRFALAYDRRHSLRTTAPGNVILVVGENDWEFPAPIVETEGRWSFDTAAGANEIRTRTVGLNELDTIEVLAGLVRAQREYLIMNPQGDAIPSYAARIASSPGKRDGLYWSDAKTPPISPVGPAVAEAYASGDLTPSVVQNQSFHGYYFRVLKSQGPSAAGGARSYSDDTGHMTQGFAIIAWPAVYGETGVMTFVVAEDAVVYQRDLGSDTVTAAIGIPAFDPEQGWSKAQ